MRRVVYGSHSCGDRRPARPRGSVGVDCQTLPTPPCDRILGVRCYWQTMDDTAAYDNPSPDGRGTGADRRWKKFQLLESKAQEPYSAMVRQVQLWNVCRAAAARDTSAHFSVRFNAGPGDDAFGFDQFGVSGHDGLFDMRYRLYFVPSVRESLLEFETVLLVEQLSCERVPSRVELGSIGWNREKSVRR